jgi:hypothetical protein
MQVDIPIHADVICLDGDAGTSKALIVDPVQRRLTHVVVRENRFAGSERLVSIDLVKETSEGAIWLRCTRDELHGLDDFIDAHFVDLTHATPPVSLSHDLPYPSPTIISERMPKGELALRRHSRVEASDGLVGQVESLVVDAADDRISHVVVRTHSFLSRQEVAVPVTNVERLCPDYVFVQLSRREVERLPHVPLHQTYVLSALRSGDAHFVPEGTTEAGAGNSEVDGLHLEGTDLLAEDVRARLSSRGFSDEQILDWARAFLSSR